MVLNNFRVKQVIINYKKTKKVSLRSAGFKEAWLQDQID